MVLLGGDGSEAELEMAVDAIVQRPLAALAAMMDHAHSSYAHDLDSAARYLALRQRSPPRLV